MQQNFHVAALRALDDIQQGDACTAAAASILDPASKEQPQTPQASGLGFCCQASIQHSKKLI